MYPSSLGLLRQQKQLHLLLHAGQQGKGKFLLWGKKHPNREHWIRSVLKKPIIYLEDGFLRSLGLGVEGWPPFSMVIDDLGIYYDTTRPSRLEHLLLQSDQMPSEILEQSRQAIDLIVNNRLSKYNHAPDFSDGLTHKIMPSEKQIVLVIDQTFGDMAVKYGAADEQTFTQMLEAALSENPDAEIWIKTHPDVLSGKKKGYLTTPPHQSNIRILAEDINPISLLQAVDKIYCVTSQMGFEGLLCGKPVITFGLPWYAGWGVCDDRHPDISRLLSSGRRTSCSLEQLFAGAYLQYSRYINPYTGETGSLFDVINYLTAARRLNEKLRGDIYCIGMSLWKRAVMKPFFNVPSCRLHFVSSLKSLQKKQLSPQARLLAWGRGHDDLATYAAKNNLPLLRMEDGFIRSVGLGSNLVPPLSLVIDDIGIYFNAQTPSRLEYILQNQHFEENDIQTALLLRQSLTESAITKYNIGGSDLQLPTTDKKVLLVPGQVEDDASIRYGSPTIYTNLELLKTVRATNPDAYILYKPHPDVVSGNRIGGVSDKDAKSYADQIVAEIDILTCLEHADEVHTMTSLTGFEALLRGKQVYCYGLPFYAGWGLTHDFLPIDRRSRKLSLEELIAGTLIHYPSYIHPETRRLITPDIAIEVIKKQKSMQKSNNLLHRNWLSKQLGKLKQLYLSLK
ncbi:capsular polysaccharide biosynthesis protein [Neisseria sp. S1]|uniref:capsular polysaccharide biosynthesis protein n=1 Tax=Neisseria sp. S1 TaxID=3318354 RepID=UPI003A88263D